MAKQSRLGSGKRFKALTVSLKKRGVKDPAALAAWIGRRKYGERFQKLSARARVRAHRRSGGVVVKAHYRCKRNKSEVTF